MKTTTEILQEALLLGRHINKFDFMNMTPTHSVALAQRVEELRKQGWLIRSRSIEGKGSLREYWLDKDEIARIKAQNKAIAERNKRDEELVEQIEKALEKPQKEPKTESYEQLGIGLLGGRNY